MSIVPAQYFEYIVEQSEYYGVDIQTLLNKLQINVQKVKSSGRISDFEFSRLYQSVMRELQDEWFGMFAGGRVPLGAFRLMLSSVIHAHNLRQAIIAGGEFAEICRGLKTRLIISEQGDTTRLTLGPIRSCPQLEFNDLQDKASSNHIFASLFAYHRCHCWATSTELKIQRLGVTFSDAESILPLSQFNAVEVLQQQDSNFIEYSLSDLELPIVQNYDAVIDFVRNAPFHVVTLDKSQISVTEKVRAILNKDVSGNMPNADTVAGQLHMSSTSLRRKLQAENTSFQTLKDECRLSAALHYLSCLELTNTEVAEKLGFDEPSAFFRAFKKWTGETPGTYRKRFETTQV